MHHYTRMWQIIPGVGQHGEIPYVLVCQPVPGRFLSGVMAGTKTLLIDLMKQCRNHVVIHHWVFAGYAWPHYSFLLLYPHMDISWGFPLPIGHWWHHYYIIPLPAEALPLSDESSNQRLSHLDTPSHMHFNHQEGYPKVHSSSNFWRGNILCSQHTSTGNTLYTLTHMFKVSACVHLVLHTNFTHISTYLTSSWHMCTWLKSDFFLLKMVDWTFEDALAAIQSPPSIPTSVLQSADGICLGDVRFAKICTTLWMCAVSLAVLKKWVENGSFNPEHMAGWLQSFYSNTAHIVSRCSTEWHRECGDWVDCPLTWSTAWTGIFHSLVN